MLPPFTVAGCRVADQPEDVAGQGATGKDQARRSPATPDASVCLPILDELPLPRHKAALNPRTPTR